MKKVLTFLAALSICAVSMADEGMWLLPLLQKMNSDAMRNIGLRLTPEEIYSINHSSLKDAVVHFGGGCTGEIISKDGLLVTNHHCGYSSIQALSTPEHNYLEDGYWATDRTAELPCEGLTVTFLQKMEDVTGVMKKAAGEGPDAIARAKRELEAQAVKDNPSCRASVVSFYNENVYYLITAKVYEDVRFVGAPPASVGKFGGDTDNWMWPRHTCDFSMFRVYAGADNEPAKYSPDNKPYSAVKSLKISLKGVREGDFAMILGYPGRTQRFQTAVQLGNMLAVNEVRIAARTIRQDILWKEMRADGTVGLQYANKYARSSNGWKKWIGMRQAFAALDIIGREQKEEADFSSWVAKKKKRQELYGGALEKIDSLSSANAELNRSFALLTETVYNIELLQLSQASNERPYKDYNEAVDRMVAVAMLKHYLENVRPGDAISFPGPALNPGNVEEYVAWLFDNSVYTSFGKKMDAVAAGKDLNQDPAGQLYDAAMAAFKAMVPALRKASGEIAPASKAYTAGLLAWRKGTPSYPDANSTMRLTYGTVKGYEPKDGVVYKYYTTLKGVAEKEDPDNYEFRVPARLRQIWETRDFGQYADADGSLRTCFLTNCDITGGNSGSPVLDADGNLIGLAFDGNWESMSSDVMFEPDLQRCICVDIRYVLLMMDKFGGAGYLLNEMEIVK